jgi:hypothetical protein
VSLQLPGYLVVAMNVVGLPWPGLDEDELRAWAASTRRFASGIDASSSAAHASVTALNDESESSFTAALYAQSERHRQLISNLHDPISDLAAGLADVVVAQKWICIGALVTLAAELTEDAIGAFLTFGLNALDAIPEVLATREVIRGVLEFLGGLVVGEIINGVVQVVSDYVSRTLGSLLDTGLGVVIECQSLRISYASLRQTASSLRGQVGETEADGSAAYAENSTRNLDDDSGVGGDGDGGGWAAVMQALEQALSDLAGDLFHLLPSCIARVFTDEATAADDYATGMQQVDATLAKNEPHPDTAPDSVSGEGATPVPGQSGGTVRPPGGESFAAWQREEEWAGNAYDAIRGDDDTAAIVANVSDVPRADASIGYSAEEIRQVKAHVFNEEHPLAGIEEGTVVMARYDPDADMAEAWLRLRNGTALPEDYVLLEHELTESNYYASHPGAPYAEAHAAANQVANWQILDHTITNEDYAKPWGP